MPLMVVCSCSGVDHINIETPCVEVDSHIFDDLKHTNDAPEKIVHGGSIGIPRLADLVRRSFKTQRSRSRKPLVFLVDDESEFAFPQHECGIDVRQCQKRSAKPWTAVFSQDFEDVGGAEVHGTSRSTSIFSGEEVEEDKVVKNDESSSASVTARADRENGKQVLSDDDHGPPQQIPDEDVDEDDSPVPPTPDEENHCARCGTDAFSLEPTLEASPGELLFCLHCRTTDRQIALWSGLISAGSGIAAVCCSSAAALPLSAVAIGAGLVGGLNDLRAGQQLKQRGRWYAPGILSPVHLPRTITRGDKIFIPDENKPSVRHQCLVVLCEEFLWVDVGMGTSADKDVGDKI